MRANLCLGQPRQFRDGSGEPSYGKLIGLVVACVTFAAPLLCLADADLIVHNGKIASVDDKFTIHAAMAVEGGKITALGSDAEVLKAKGEKTRVIDLAGKLVLPGLIDSHVHPGMASMHEFERPIPEMETIQDVLDFIAARAKAAKEGEWIQLSQIFITRLREQRYPTKAELDRAAPKNPVVFATGPDASVNSLALSLSGIDKKYVLTGQGRVERDPTTGEPTGILRSCTSILKVKSSGKSASQEERIERLLTLIADYHSVGLTGIIDRDAGGDEVDRYRVLHEADKLSIRVAISRSQETKGSVATIERDIRELAKNPLCKPNPRLRIIGIKTYLDGGMLTGSAYMRQPWGVSKIYSIDDPNYKGLLYIPRERLLPIVKTTVESGLQFTAHSVGDGAVHALLDVYEEVNRSMPVKPTRPCITHSNFMSREAIEQMARIGAVCDIQPAWLYLDTRTLVAQFGNERLRYFQPLRSLFEAGVIAGGGSDHMQKIGSLRAINPYNPFLGMWVTITRQARWYEGRLHPEESLTRQQAIRFYTRNNANLMFLEDHVGSLERGKLADFIVVDRDLLSCPVDDIRQTTVLQTFVEGTQVFPKPDAE